MPCAPCQQRQAAMMAAARERDVVATVKHAVAGSLEMLGLKEKQPLNDGSVPADYTPQAQPEEIDAPGVIRY